MRCRGADIETPGDWCLAVAELGLDAALTTLLLADPRPRDAEGAGRGWKSEPPTVAAQHRIRRDAASSPRGLSGPALWHH